jgi:hypothetical protein
MSQDITNEAYEAGLKAGRQIVILAKEVYGRQMFYPVCEVSRLFAAIADRATLSEVNVRRIRQLGYEVTVTHLKPINIDFTNP